MTVSSKDRRLGQIREKVQAGERLTFDEGLFLETDADLFTLGELANLVRERHNGNVAYYNVNEHLNPTNVCVYRCVFCAFRADLKSERGGGRFQRLHRASHRRRPAPPIAVRVVFKHHSYHSPAIPATALESVYRG